jgi:hypothetical protein
MREYGPSDKQDARKAIAESEHDGVVTSDVTLPRFSYSGKNYPTLTGEQYKH